MTNLADPNHWTSAIGEADIADCQRILASEYVRTKAAYDQLRTECGADHPLVFKVALTLDEAERVGNLDAAATSGEWVRARYDLMAWRTEIATAIADAAH